ncbi:MAG TPA: alkaline phosphatase [Bacteroidales bacterium]|nr:alkaline phosphatase [Bacteroidales bacterium]
MNKKNQQLFRCFAFVIVISIILQSCKTPIKTEGLQGNSVKNLIVMIPDGCSIELLQLARLYKAYPNSPDNTVLSFDSLICGLLKVNTATTVMGESAANATAIFTGVKTKPGYLATDTTGNELSSVFSLARDIKNKAIGIVGTVDLAQATLSAPLIHSKNRGDYNDIIKQLAYNGADVLFASGGKGFINRDFTKKDNNINTIRKDKLNLEDVVTKDKNIHLCFYKKDFDNIDTTNYHKIWWLYNSESNCMPNDFDRADTVPSLSEMTLKAISILKHNKNGFVLLVEGSKIDWAAHSNDPIGVLSEFLAFEKAVEVALKFAREDKNTAVIIMPDHGTGGITIGNQNSNAESNNNYHKLNYKDFGNPIFINKNKLYTGEGLRKILKYKTDSIIAFYKAKNLKDCPSNAQIFLKKFINNIYSISFSDEDIETLIKNVNLSDNDFADIFGPIYSKYTYIGWTTNGHTGEDVFMAIYHPKNYVKKGIINLTEITEYIKEILKL